MYEMMPERRMLRCQTCGAALPIRTGNKSHVKCTQCGAATNAVDACKALDKAQKGERYGVTGVKEDFLGWTQRTSHTHTHTLIQMHIL
ncbi:hypothetical protein E2C01_083601 [Portunus trituberculatus]|uniref:Uncharacterized protein n=1 Tax=Portunus trituberculatus TaxID=210409 RepID=A0A5B7IXL7_PORTR|nr:hypothetical protein [Portunus trituberculatus]